MAKTKYKPNERTIQIGSLDNKYNYFLEPNGSIFTERKDAPGNYYNFEESLTPDKLEQAKGVLREFANTMQNGGGSEILSYIDGAATSGTAEPPEVTVSSSNTIAGADAPTTSAPGIISPIPTQPVTGKQVVSNTPAKTLDLSTPQISSEPDIFSELFDETLAMDAENEANLKNQEALNASRIANKKGLAAGSLITNLFSQGLQDTTYEPVTKNTSLINEQYRGIPNSVVEAQSNKIKSQTAGLGRQLLEQGLRPSQVSSILAETQGKVAEADSNLRYNFFNNQYTQQKAKYEDLRNTIDANSAAVIKAKESSRDDQNKLLAATGDNFVDYLDSLDKIGTNKALLEDSSVAGYTKNKNQNLQNRINIGGMDSDLKLTRKQHNDFFKYWQQYLSTKNKK